MKITRLTINKVSSEGAVKAISTVEFNSCIVVENVQIIEGNNGYTVAFPCFKDEDGIGQSVVSIIDAESQKELQKQIIDLYRSE